MKKYSEDDFDFVRLDRNRLHLHLEDQPTLVIQYGVQLAEAEEDHDRAQNEEGVVWADIDKDVRMNPDKYGLAKLTEPGINNAITLHAKYQQAREKTIQARKAVNILKRAMEALQQRGHSLEGLIKLHLAGYFSVPKISGEERDELRDQRRKEIRRLGQFTKE